MESRIGKLKRSYQSRDLLEKENPELNRLENRLGNQPEKEDLLRDQLEQENLK